VRSLVALTTLFLLVTLCGCGASLPTEDIAKKAFQDELARPNDNRVQLVSFHKTNGQSSVVNGVKHYTMEWEGEVEVTEDGICDPGNHSSPVVRVLKDTVMDMTAWGGKKAVIPHDPHDIVKKGERRKVSGQFLFIMTEKGWIVSGTSSVQMEKPW
jgi:hypothetical protein